MTNKEAVTILNSIKMFFCREDGTPFSVGYDAITKAVKLLERLPDEHGDLIDRDALLEKYNKKGVNIAECLTDERTAKAFEKFCIIADAVEAAEAVIAAERKDDE